MAICKDSEAEQRRGHREPAYFLGALDSGNPRAGMAALRRTLQRVTGIRVQGCVLVDFDGFRRVIDAIGGLDIDVPHDIHDEFVGEDGERFSAHFARGRHQMDGERALIYARTRKADGDEWRRQRHVDLALALVSQGKLLRSPARILGPMSR